MVFGDNCIVLKVPHFASHWLENNEALLSLDETVRVRIQKQPDLLFDA
jgi:hypothetical protein